MQPGFLYTAVDVFNCILITGYNMKVGSNLYAAITNRVRNILKIIDSKFLRYHINDLIAGRYIGFILIIYQLINFPLCNFIFGALSYYIAAGLQAFNVM